MGQLLPHAYAMTQKRSSSIDQCCTSPVMYDTWKGAVLVHLPHFSCVWWTMYPHLVTPLLSYRVRTYVPLCTVEDWRLKWGLTSQLEGAGEAEVTEALCSPSEGVRLNALYHCAKVAMALQTAAHKQTRRRSSIREGEGRGNVFSPLYTYVAPVERLLRDSSVSIKVAAAVWLTVVGRWSEKVHAVLGLSEVHCGRNS